MRNIISHEYLSIDPEVIFATVKKRLPPLLADIRQILQDIKNGLRDAEIQSLATKSGTIRTTNVFTDSAPAQERVRMPGRNFM